MAPEQQQPDVQLAHPADTCRGSSAITQLNDDDARLVNMCPNLYCAVQMGRTEEVMALLQEQHGASNQAAAGITRHGWCDVLEMSAEGNTVLHVAAEHGHGGLIRELCLRFNEKKGLLSRRNSALDTPLHCAARAGHVTAVSVLMQLAQERGEDILGCKNEAGDTALHLAAMYGYGAAVEALVSKAETAASELNNAGVSPLYLAVMSGSVLAVRAITSSCRDASAAGPSSQNALHAAVFQSADMVQLLLEWRPALADEVDCSGSTPLHFASSDGHLSNVRAILRAAPPRTVYRKDHDGGLSALHVAARMGHYLVVSELLHSCPDAAELRDDGGKTFLHAAAMEKRSSVVSLAVKVVMLHGLLDARDKDGNTPLHFAVAAGAPKCVEILLRKGKVRGDVLNNDGHTAFDLAVKSTCFFTMVNLVLTLVAFGAQNRPQRQDHLKQWSDRDIGLAIEKTSDSLVVVAVLIATVAFAAGFQLPGGYGDNGMANLKDDFIFQRFVIVNTVSVATSVLTVILLVYGKAERSAGSRKSFIAAMYSFWMSCSCLVLAFCFSTAIVSPRSKLAVRIIMFITMLLVSLWVPASFSLTTFWGLWRSRNLNSRQHLIIKRQYPLATALYPSVAFFVAMSAGWCFSFIISLT